MDTKEQVLHYLHATADAPDAEIEVIIQLLDARGITHADAGVLIAFVPIAFAHVWLGRKAVRFVDGFEAIDPVSDVRVRGRLTDQPVFQTACALAEETLATTGGESFVRLVASRSAEYQSAEALVGCVEHASQEALADLGFTPPLLLWVSLDRLIVQVLEEEKPKRKIKSWKFWRPAESDIGEPIGQLRFTHPAGTYRDLRPFFAVNPLLHLRNKLIPKLYVEGSIPFARSSFPSRFERRVGMAQVRPVSPSTPVSAQPYRQLREDRLLQSCGRGHLHPGR